MFVKRLQQGMRLQTDPAVIYGLGERFDGNLTRRDLDRDQAFNTYTREGLPPTPIALPSQASLDAVLHPQETPYLYFVSRGDGSSEFSASLAKHNRAVAKYRAARAERTRANASAPHHRPLLLTPAAQPRHGRFITVEGIDGAGKSTHLPLLKQMLERAGREVWLTREPGGTPLGERLRELLLHESMTHLAETLLMFAARREHCEREIWPRLAAGTWVVCDRFTDATTRTRAAATASRARRSRRSSATR